MALTPEQLAHFIRSSVDSVEQLEVLCLLHDQPEREWSPLELSREIRSTEGSVSKRLAGLVANRVLLPAAGDRFRYQPASEDAREKISEMLAFYRLRPHKVMDLLYSRPESAMQTFADAFRLKKDPK